MKVACIAQHRHLFSVALMCHLLGVSRSGFYAAQCWGSSQRARDDQRLQLEIGAIHRHRAGARMVVRACMPNCARKACGAGARAWSACCAQRVCKPRDDDATTAPRTRIIRIQ